MRAATNTSSKGMLRGKENRHGQRRGRSQIVALQHRSLSHVKTPPLRSQLSSGQEGARRSEEEQQTAQQEGFLRSSGSAHPPCESER